MKLNDSTKHFLLELYRGGSGWAHYWIPDGPGGAKISLWFNSQNPPEVPDLWKNCNIYFSVNTAQIARTAYQKMTNAAVTTVGAIYADYDGLDSIDIIDQLDPRPTIVTNSGGGYHGYWLLEQPYQITTEEQREHIALVQKRWVEMAGADDGAKDLARVLRLPGFLNRKAKYGPNFPMVDFHRGDGERVSLEAIEAAIIANLGADSLDISGKSQNGIGTRTPGPKMALDDEKLVEKAISAKDGERFRRLWDGDLSDYGGDHSSADQALVNLLAFWTGGDTVQIDRLFRSSGLYRPKWDRDDYRDATIDNAIGNLTATYDPGIVDDSILAAQSLIDPHNNGSNGAHRMPPGATGSPQGSGTGKTAVNPTLEDYLLNQGADDEGNAQCVLKMYGEQIVYTPAVGYLMWNGKYWQAENAEARVTRAIVDTLQERRILAAKHNRDPLIRAAKPSAANVKHAEQLFRSLVSVDIHRFDNHPDILNCNNGMVDLRTGTLKPHSPGHYLTYCLGTDYNPGADQVEWLEALYGWLDKSEIVNFVQTAMGYSVTGYTNEEILFYCWGETRSGKGTFNEAILKLLPRPIGLQADFQTFTAQRTGDTQNFDLAPLKPARYISASETKNRESLNEAKVKQVTGGDYIRCAFKHRDHFEYRPQFKIWMFSNFAVRGDVDDSAFWGRLRVIYFPHSWLGKEDKTLKLRLQSPQNLEGVLAWIVEGAIRWFRDGLQTPEAVERWTRLQRDDLDTVQQWIDENCKPGGWTETRVLFTNYQNWAHDLGVTPKGLPNFGHSLKSKGFDKARRINTLGKQKWGIDGLTIA